VCIKGGFCKIVLENIEIKLEYKFKDPKLLQNALTHTSYYKQIDKSKSNNFQRLEFLGDSVLNLIVSEYLFKKFPFFSEGQLSILKSTIISQSFLVKIAYRIQLEENIITGKSVDLKRGRGKFSILVDCLESCFGALYMDGGLKPCKKVINNLIKDKEIKELLDRENIRDYKTMLQEISQKNYNCLPKYKIIKDEGLDHQKVFSAVALIKNDIYGEGSGTSKKEAEQNAAYQALNKIKNL